MLRAELVFDVVRPRAVVAGGVVAAEGHGPIRLDHEPQIAVPVEDRVVRDVRVHVQGLALGVHQAGDAPGRAVRAGPALGRPWRSRRSLGAEHRADEIMTSAYIFTDRAMLKRIWPVVRESAAGAGAGEARGVSRETARAQSAGTYANDDDGRASRVSRRFVGRRKKPEDALMGGGRATDVVPGGLRFRRAAAALLRRRHFPPRVAPPRIASRFPRWRREWGFAPPGRRGLGLRRRLGLGRRARPRRMGASSSCTRASVGRKR